MPIDRDCPKDSERPVYGHHFDQQVMNLASAADSALSLLTSFFPAKDGKYVEVVDKLKRALEALDEGE